MASTDPSSAQTHRSHTQNAEAWRDINFLSIDGGGVRGLWALYMLDRLMDFVGTEEEKDLTMSEDPNYLHSSFSPEPFPENLSHNYRQSQSTQPSKRSRRYLPCHYFDYIGGTSMGALIAIMIGRLRMSVSDCIDEYLQLGGEVFGRPHFFTETRSLGIIRRPKHDTQRYENVCRRLCDRRKEIVGDNQDEDGPETIFELRPELCKTFVTAFRSDGDAVGEGPPDLLRSYDHDESFRTTTIRSLTQGNNNRSHAHAFIYANPDNIHNGHVHNSLSQRVPAHARSTLVGYGNASQLKIWQVARGATAADTMFEPLKIPKHGSRGIDKKGKQYTSYTDGGFSPEINPTKVGFEEIEERHGKDAANVVVSVGTARKDARPKKFIISRARKYLDRSWDPEINHCAMEALEARRKKSFCYFRLNDPGRLPIKLDEWKPRRSRFGNNQQCGQKTIREIQTAFNEWAQRTENFAYLTDCAKLLVASRRARAQVEQHHLSRAVSESRWESYATGAVFSCPEKQLCRRKEIFPERNSLRKHLEAPHSWEHGEELEKELSRCKREWTYPILNGV